MLSERSRSAAVDANAAGSAGVKPTPEGPEALRVTQAEPSHVPLHGVSPTHSLPSSPPSSPLPTLLPLFSTPSSPLDTLSKPTLLPSHHQHGAPDSTLSSQPLYISENPTEDLVAPLLRSFASLHVEDGLASAKARMPSPPLWYVPTQSPVHRSYHV